MTHFTKKSDNSGEKTKKKHISISMGIQRKVFLVFFLFILIITITTTGVVYEHSKSALREELQDHLVDLAKTCALMIDADEHAQLETPADMDTDNHEEIKSVLQSVMEVNPKIADIYMMVKSDEENIFLFVVDAYGPTIGDEYDISPYPKMKEAFDGAILDCGEEGCSAYAPIYDEAGKAIAILGVELYMDEFLDEEKNLDVIQDYWVGVVENAASEIDADKLAELKTPEDEHTAAYGELKSILESVKDKNPEIYEIYIMAESDKENILLYLVDVYEPPEIGEEYDVSEYPQMQLAFDGAIADEEITIDMWGAWLSAYAPIYDDNGTAVAIVGLDMDAGNVVIAEENLRNRLIFIFLAAVLLSVIATIFVSRYFTKHITELVEGTKAISRGNFDYKVAIKSGDELEALGDAVNKMAQRIKNSFTETVIKKELENTLNTMTDTLIVLDPDGDIIKANKAAFNLLGYSEAEVIGMSFDKIVGKPKQEEEGKIELKKLIREPEASITNLETTYLTKDRREIPVNFAASIMKNENGELQGIVCNACDITERKQAEEALRESEERFRAISETAQDSIFIKDRALKYTLVNPTMERLFGLPASKIIGKTDDDLFDKEAALHIREVDSHVLKGETVEEEHTKKIKGVLFSFHVIKVPMRDNSGEVIGLCGIARDITERKRAEEALRESEERYRSIFESIQDVYAEVAMDGTILEITPSIQSFSGYAPEEVLGRSLAEFYVYPEQRAALLERLRLGGSVNDYEVVLRHKTGRAVTSSFTVKVVTDASGTPVKIVGTMRDVTERKRLDDERERLIKKLGELDKMKTNFLNVAYHEMRSPLAPIVGYASLLEQGELNEKQKKYVRIIEESASQLEELIESMLEVTRLEAGKAELSLEKMSIPEIVNNVLERFGPQADAKKQTISAVVPEGTEVEGDKQKITAIFDNLISNAIKYTGEKGRIDIVVEDRKEGIRVCVADTGIGIPKEQLPRAFERFFMADTSLRRKGGLGLGLAIVKGYVKLHGGEVWVTSELGKGSKFWFTLPKRRN
nr:putative sensory transduction histidine kinase [uncultured archaeon]